MPAPQQGGSEAALIASNEAVFKRLMSNWKIATLRSQYRLVRALLAMTKPQQAPLSSRCRPG
jgi:hypothetical protein